MNLSDLIEKVDHIEGHTVDGRFFKINTKSLILSIYNSKNEVYEKQVSLFNVNKTNILSCVNSVEKNFFNKFSMRRTERKAISINGSIGDELFTMNISINNLDLSSFLIFRGRSDSVGLNRKSNIPDYIDSSQKHTWLYLHYQQPKYLIPILEFFIKDRHYNCCGRRVSGDMNYCAYCSKKQEVTNLKISNVSGQEFLTKLTK